MKLRNVLSGLVLGASLVVLTACGQDPKEEVLSATKTLQEAQQLNYSTTFSLDVALDQKVYTAEDQKEADELKKASLVVDVKSDKKTLKEEATLGFSYKEGTNNITFKLPMFADINANKVYVKADDLSVLSLLLPESDEFFTPFEGKTIEVDLNDEALALESTLKDELASQEKMNDALLKTLTDLPEANFTEKDGKHEVTLKGKELKTFAKDVLTILVDTTPTLTKEDKDLLNEEMNNLNFDNAKIVVSYELDGKKVKSQNMVLTVDAKEEGVVVKLTGKTVYKSINEPVKFTFDTKKDIVKMAEVFDAIAEYEESSLNNEEEYLYDLEDADFNYEELETEEVDTLQ